MRVLYLYCHPLPESFHRAIRNEALAGLAQAGHSVDLLDLYEERFDPVMSVEGRRCYHDVTRNRDGIESYAERLLGADSLIVQFPIWCFGPPAMLKGFFDRLLIPGIAFDLSDRHRVRPILANIRKITGIVTYGRPRLTAWLMGDPPRKIVTRYLPWFVARGAPVEYLALYNLNVVDERQRRRFIQQVRSSMSHL